MSAGSIPQTCSHPRCREITPGRGIFCRRCRSITVGGEWAIRDIVWGLREAVRSGDVDTHITEMAESVILQLSREVAAMCSDLSQTPTQDLLSPDESQSARFLAQAVAHGPIRLITSRLPGRVRRRRGLSVKGGRLRGQV
ncbi:hypothetical protein GGTG_13753 [Gaeumannomyces tritici R3-111a-1]|uniref:Uncharacterized protein n=1 Tax=Gaeumannomyces tritici (strain R3-111a-1) TaxID=644352 RepID=J3PJR4_GAET3|nr:hypothetical protein GGTG_13753 [Gaeumannomyces tritici R3-111a-1]EJT68679.1 hypothetical protein GGTG_13753 [Gaeumannomyces tritici R3-111a-1]